MKRNITFIVGLALILTGCMGQQPQQPVADTTSLPVDEKPAEVVSSDAVLSLVSDTENVKTGEEFTVQVLLESNTTPVTTVTPYVLYDTTLLEVENVELTGSKFPVSYRNEIDKTAGVVELSLSPSGEGMTGNDLLVATITFKAKKAGSATIAFEQKRTKVLTADNTNIVSDALNVLTIEVKK